jgi:hypothetical protein
MAANYLTDTRIRLLTNGIEQPFQLAQLDPVTFDPLSFVLPLSVRRQPCFLIASENSIVQIQIVSTFPNIFIDESTIGAYGQLLLSRGFPTNFEIGSI